jgi:hypothetical protein
VVTFYGSKEALLEEIFYDRLIGNSFAKKCPEGGFVLDEAVNHLLENIGCRWCLGLFAFSQIRPV